MRPWLSHLCASVLAVSFLNVPAAVAQSPEEFYKSHAITVLIGGGVGGGYDLYTRTFARHLANHIPGSPSIVSKNLPAASGLVAANTLYTTAEKDGSVIAALTNSVPTEPLLGNPAARYDALKFNWLGSLGKLPNVCSMWHTSSIKSIAQAREREVTVAASGIGTNSAVIPKVLNGLLGTRFRLVTGYDPTMGINMAIEREEAEGICGLSWPTIKSSRPAWVRDKLITIIVQVAFDKIGDLPDVPSALDLIIDPKKRSVLELILIRQETGRPLAAPPGVPADRLSVLRKAFDETLQDPKFRAEAEKFQMEIDPLSSTQMEALLLKAYASPKQVVDAAAALVESPTARK
jgi:tripartite-type tricarboxylate transporter receptor subunit TctC